MSIELEEAGRWLILNWLVYSSSRARPLGIICFFLYWVNQIIESESWAKVTGPDWSWKVESGGHRIELTLVTMYYTWSLLCEAFYVYHHFESQQPIRWALMVSPFNRAGGWLVCGERAGRQGIQVLHPGSLRPKLLCLTLQVECPKGSEKMMKIEKGLGRKGTNNFDGKES